MRDHAKFDQKFATARELKFLHSSAIFLHLASGALGAWTLFSFDPRVPVTAPLIEFVDNSATYFRYEPRVWFTTSVLWPLVSVEFITATSHIVYLLALIFPAVDKGIRKYVVNTPSLNPLRWVEYGITATIMTSFGSVNLGITDAYFFVKQVGDGVALQVCGVIIEMLDGENDAVFKLVWWMIGTLINFSGLICFLYQTFASSTHSALWLFIENSVPFAVWFQTFGLVARAQYFSSSKQFPLFRDRFLVERWYIVLSVSTKIAVFWLGFGTFRKILEDNGVVARTGIAWNAVRYSAMVLPAIVPLGYLLRDRIQARNLRLEEPESISSENKTAFGAHVEYRKRNRAPRFLL